MLGRWPTRYGLVSVSAQRQRALEALARVAPHISASTPAGRLSPADQQLVEIARANSEDSKVLVMDEPTTSLSPPEIDRLFAVVNDLKARGWPSSSSRTGSRKSFASPTG
jgi:ABC-type sugar transport system ATPase subunit